MSDHPKEAVEAVARALWAQGAAFTETWEYDGKPVPGYLVSPAIALLDQIAPLLTRAALDRAEADKAAAVEATLDAAGAYMGQQYGNTALLHPVDRARIITAIRPVGATHKERTTNEV